MSWLGPKIVETRHAVFLENEYFSGRTELKKLTSNEVSTPMMEYGVTQEVSCNENENVPTTKVFLRRSQREKRPAISNDYEVYLNECDYDVGLESDPRFELASLHIFLFKILMIKYGIILINNN